MNQNILCFCTGSRFPSCVCTGLTSAGMTSPVRKYSSGGGRLRAGAGTWLCDTIRHHNKTRQCYTHLTFDAVPRYPVIPSLYPPSSLHPGCAVERTCRHLLGLFCRLYIPCCRRVSILNRELYSFLDIFKRLDRARVSRPILGTSDSLEPIWRRGVAYGELYIRRFRVIEKP